MVSKVKIDPIKQYGLERSDQKTLSTPSPSNPRSPLREALKARIQKDMPDQFLVTKKELAGFVPTDMQKRMVWKMAAMGANHAIMRLATIDPATNEPITDAQLVGIFGEIIRHAREQANFTIALKIYEMALGQDAEYDQDGNIIRPFQPPNLDALRWWDRSRGEAKKLLDMRISRAVNGDDDPGKVTLVIEG